MSLNNVKKSTQTLSLTFNEKVKNSLYYYEECYDNLLEHPIKVPLYKLFSSKKSRTEYKTAKLISKLQEMHISRGVCHAINFIYNGLSETMNIPDNHPFKKISTTSYWCNTPINVFENYDRYNEGADFNNKYDEILKTVHRRIIYLRSIINHPDFEKYD